MRTPSVAMLMLAAVLTAPGAEAQRVGTAAPEIESRTLGGKLFKLSGLKGRPVVMTFWGTWCPPCRDEFPELTDAYNKHHADGLEVGAVNQRDQELSDTAVQKFVDEFLAPFTIVLDPKGRSRRAYRLVGLPTTVFIDTAGVITKVFSGPIPREQLGVGLTSLGIQR